MGPRRRARPAPWARLQERPDPAAAVVDLGDAVYAAAVTLAGWPADLVGERFTGWYASTTPPAGALTDR